MPGNSVAFTKKKKKKSCHNYSWASGKNKQTNKQTNIPTTRRKGKKNALVAKSQFGTTAKLLILDALPFAAVVQQLLEQVWGLP